MSFDTNDQENVFPVGARIFFRTVGGTTMTLHNLDLLKARSVATDVTGWEQFLIFYDENQKFLSALPIDAIAAVVPLETTGPTNASN